MSPFKDKFTAGPNLDSEGFDQNGLFCRGIIDQPDEPASFRHEQMPHYTAIDERMNAALARHGALTEQLASIDECFDSFRIMSDEELEARHRAWLAGHMATARDQ